MALNESTLKSELLKAFNEIKQTKNSPQAAPLLSPVVAEKLANAYHKYAGDAIAGGCTSQVTKGQVSTLKDSLSSIPLFLGWGPGMLAYWTPVTFTGGGFIPVNPTVPAEVIGVTADLLLLLPPNPITIKNEDEFAGKLATVLHKWTKKINVTTTTTSTPPVNATVPLS